VRLLREWNEKREEVNAEGPDIPASGAAVHGTTEQDGDGAERSTAQQQPRRYTRVCCMCAQAPALPCADDDDDDDDDDEAEESVTMQSDRPLRLRELKTLQRQQDRKKKSPMTKKAADTDDQIASNEEYEGGVHEEEDASVEEGESFDRGEDGTEDPFLEAVGGVDKLLLGEAYQERLLRAASGDAGGLNMNTL
jgi:hypothetical protein